MNVQQAGNKLMSVALNTELAHDKEFVLAIKTLVDASKKSRECPLYTDYEKSCQALRDRKAELNA